MIPKRLKDARLASGLSQEKLAIEMLDLHRKKTQINNHHDILTEVKNQVKKPMNF